MERRTLLKTSGAALASLSIAGCLSDGNQSNPKESGGGGGEGASDPNANEQGQEGQQDQGDEPVVNQDPGWFNIDGEVLTEKNADNLKITNHFLYRTNKAFGVQFTVKNTGNEAYTYVQAHAKLVNAQDQQVGGGPWTTSFGNPNPNEQENIDDLAPGEKWTGDIRFENTSPPPAKLFENNDVSYQIWVTGQTK